MLRLADHSENSLVYLLFVLGKVSARVILNMMSLRSPHMRPDRLTPNHTVASEPAGSPGKLLNLHRPQAEFKMFQVFPQEFLFSVTVTFMSTPTRIFII